MTLPLSNLNHLPPHKLRSHCTRLQELPVALIPRAYSNMQSLFMPFSIPWQCNTISVGRNNFSFVLTRPTFYFLKSWLFLKLDDGWCSEPMRRRHLCIGLVISKLSPMLLSSSFVGGLVGYGDLSFASVDIVKVLICDM